MYNRPNLIRPNDSIGRILNRPIAQKAELRLADRSASLNSAFWQLKIDWNQKFFLENIFFAINLSFSITFSAYWVFGLLKIRPNVIRPFMTFGLLYIRPVENSAFCVSRLLLIRPFVSFGLLRYVHIVRPIGLRPNDIRPIKFRPIVVVPWGLRKVRSRDRLNIILLD